MFFRPLLAYSFSAILLGLFSGSLADSDSATLTHQESLARVENAIAYPSGGLAIKRGLIGTFAGGNHKNAGDLRSLYQWQGELGYYYRPWFSAGSGFKMVAGEPSDSSQLVKSRFFISSRFHKSLGHASGYLGAQLGLDDLNISLVDTLRNTLSNTNAGGKLEFGLGWKIWKSVGITFGHQFEFSFVGEDTSNIENAVNFRTLPGLALDMLPIFPSLNESVKAFQIFTELQFGQLIKAKKSRRQDFVWMLGISAGF